MSPPFSAVRDPHGEAHGRPGHGARRGAAEAAAATVQEPGRAEFQHGAFGGLPSGKLR